MNPWVVALGSTGTWLNAEWRATLPGLSCPATKSTGGLDEKGPVTHHPAQHRRESGCRQAREIAGSVRASIEVTARKPRHYGGVSPTEIWRAILYIGNSLATAGITVVRSAGTVALCS
jgi:hypothetical protein